MEQDFPGFGFSPQGDRGKAASQDSSWAEQAPWAYAHIRITERGSGSHLCSGGQVRHQVGCSLGWRGQQAGDVGPEEGAIGQPGRSVRSTQACS